jgi:hypothetical protein
MEQYGKYQTDARGPSTWHDTREVPRTCETQTPPWKIMVTAFNPKEGAVMGSSLGVRPEIVLRDGCAVHMGKDLAR